MPDRIELTPSQRTRCNRLIRRLCANYDNGNCLPLDESDGCVCVQMISLSPDMQVFSKCGFTRRQGTVCRDFQTAYLSLRRVQSGFCAELQPTEILPGVQPKGSPKAEK